VGARLQELSPPESPAEDSVGGGSEGDGGEGRIGSRSGASSTTRGAAGRAVLDFLSTVDVGRLRKTHAAERWSESEEERRQEAEELGAEVEETAAVPPRALCGWGWLSFVFPLRLPVVISCVVSLVRSISSWKGAGRRAEGSTCRLIEVGGRTVDGNRAGVVHRHDLDRSHAINDKIKKRVDHGQFGEK
jgi:hypothetical protein